MNRLTKEQVDKRMREATDRRTLGGSFTLKEIKEYYILRRLVLCDYNRTKAAESLGIGIRTLQRLLNKELKKWKS